MLASFFGDANWGTEGHDNADVRMSMQLNVLMVEKGGTAGVSISHGEREDYGPS